MLISRRREEKMCILSTRRFCGTSGSSTDLLTKALSGMKVVSARLNFEAILLFRV